MLNSLPQYPRRKIEYTAARERKKSKEQDHHQTYLSIILVHTFYSFCMKWTFQKLQSGTQRIVAENPFITTALELLYVHWAEKEIVLLSVL